MTVILAIDPGTTQSAWVLFDSDYGPIISKGLAPNNAVLKMLEQWGDSDVHLAIEMIASYGMPVGREVFETCVWIGRFAQAWGDNRSMVYRKDVKMHLCGNNRAKDSNIRQALSDLMTERYWHGGGKNPAVGIKSDPGPCYGVSKDIWAALGVAVTCSDSELRAAAA